MMMISSSEAVSSAKATSIVSNLKAFKTAALAYYTDNADTLSFDKITQDNLFPYLQKTNNSDEKASDTLKG